jgi:hypothetical protein
MISNDVTRLVTRWLSHPTWGVAALLPQLPRNQPGTVVEDALPAVPALYNDVDTPDLAADMLDPPSTPCLIVYVANTVRTEVTHTPGRTIVKQVPVIVAYAANDVSSVQGVQGCGYVLTAAHLSLDKLNDQRASAGYREVNGSLILKVGDVQENAAAGAVGRSKLWGFLVAPVTVAYTAPF